MEYVTAYRHGTLLEVEVEVEPFLEPAYDPKRLDALQELPQSTQQRSSKVSMR